MAECMPGEIWIGGAVRASDMPDLCEAITQAGVGLDWGAKSFEPRSAADLFQARTDLDQELVLHLCDDQARHGYFEELEAFLQLRGIPFNRRGDGKYEYDPLYFQFRPGGTLIEQLTDHSGNPTIRTEPLYDVAAQLATAVSSLHQRDWRAAQTAVEAAYNKLQEQLPPSVPRLPALTVIVDGS